MLCGSHRALTGLITPTFTLTVAVLVGTGCSNTRPVPLNLVERFGEAELRSDTLDLDFLLSREELAHEGWQDVERSEGALTLWSRWSTSRLRLPLASTRPKELSFEARCHPKLGPHLSLALTLNGHPLAVRVLTAASQSFRVRLPAAYQVPGQNTLEWTVPRTGRPAGKGGRRSPPSLALSALDVRPVQPAGSGGPPRLHRGRLRLPAGSLVAFVLRGSEGTQIEFGAHSRGGTVALRVTLEGRSATRTLLEEVLDGPAVQHRRLSLDAAAGEFVQLAVANPGPGTLWIDALKLHRPGPARAPGSRTRLGRRVNLVLFLVDTLRADALGAYGREGPTSPHFDAFAQEALLFEDAWAQAPWTRPAVASIFTGLSVGSHGVGRFSRALPEGVHTLAEALSGAGYRTAGFVANHVVNVRFGFAQGFGQWNAGGTALYGASAGRLVQEALDWVAVGDQPFFLYVHTLEPHTPYAPAEEDWHSFKPAGASSGWDVSALLKQPTRSQAEMEFVRSAYDGEVRANDRAFGALLQGLRDRHLLDESVVVFLADHGEEFEDHEGLGHGHTLYQEQLWVPLAVRFPGGAGGGRREASLVQQIDLLPSLLSLLGLSPPGAIEGRDLSASWLGRSLARAEDPGLVSETGFGEAKKTAFRSGGWKLIVNDDERRFWRAGTRWELYDLATDSEERSNVIETRPLAGKWLWGRLKTRRALQHKLGRRWRTGREVNLTADDLEQLRGLGYIE